MGLHRLPLVFLVLACAAWAQQAQVAPPPAAGVVTGHVVFADTQRPARFALVTLVRVPDKATLDADMNGEVVKHAPSVVILNGTTGLDGSFTVADVPAGDWYAVANMQGYVLPIAKVGEDDEDYNDATLMREVPVVHVTANRSSDIDLALHRGGAIAGRLEFEDGSPVVGGTVRIDPVEGKSGAGRLRLQYMEALNRYDTGTTQTDDQGRFRFAGLAPDKYLVSANVFTGNGWRLMFDGERMTHGYVGRQGIVTVYAPETFRHKDAKVYEIKGDEQIGDADIRVALSGLHTVTGRLVGKEDGQPLNWGDVGLEPDDKEFVRNASVQADGTYRFEYVPPGTYTVTVRTAATVVDPKAPNYDAREYLRRFVVAKVSVVVGQHDVRMDDLLLVAEKPDKDDPP